MIRELAKATNKPCLDLYWQGLALDRILPAVPYLSEFQLWESDGHAIIMCDTVEEMEDLFNQTGAIVNPITYSADGRPLNTK